MKFSKPLVVLALSFNLFACDNPLSDPKIEKFYKSCLVDFKRFETTPNKEFSPKGLDSFCKCLAPIQAEIKDQGGKSLEDFKGEVEACKVEVLK